MREKISTQGALKNRAIFYLPFAAGALLILLLIMHYGVNTPFWDDWEMVNIFQKADAHTLSFANLWAQHNEHRIFFPNVVILGAAFVTHWNLKAQLLISFSFSLITATVLYFFIVNKTKNNVLAFVASLLVAGWVFSPVQYENWIWGWQLEWFMCVAGVVATIFLLDTYCTKKRNEYVFAGAIISSVIATFSLAGGILSWIIGLAIILAYRQTKKIVGIWLAASVVSTFLYHFHYYKPKNSPSQALFLHEPTNFLRYVLNYMGRPVTSDPTTSIFVGGLLVSITLPLLFLVWTRRSYLSKYIPWLSLMLFAFLACLVTSVSRLAPDAGLQPIASRYTAFSLLYIIGLTGLVVSLLDTFKINTKYSIIAAFILISVSIPLLFSSYQGGKAGIKYYSNYFRQTSYCTHLDNPTKECLLTTYPWDTRITNGRLDYLKSKHWAGY